ncbi:uncharacterized protein SPPG_08615 [Spizellomyces punctatus DAOM BR117]|uniref:Uncharacterized protein n=1 Tax=Spizellomyces punctatus (strain DAOM BR117) TaxID=645134 RepID=A0A0L0H4X5_SPIPD|nr:uncharacterized protein SPPG_08615 [Spizellomyces punctatus DAOM BR117]KNC96019.1 hypothetical protein SPPG_08615 [Spizellomyces punctatus DAOM BR117]|eukprot:XP_016604059.1 hypothetical protein SPPG_08615 [Spizellomyces punctatus DAOM BR117]
MADVESIPANTLTAQNEASELQHKITALATELEQERAARHKAEKEKLDTEKELKRINGVVAKSKDSRALQQCMEENARLKLELEVLSDQKLQNQALKENIHQIVAQSDLQRRQLEEKLASFTSSQNSHGHDSANPPPPYSVIQPATEVTAGLEILRAEVKALETTVRDLRAEKAHLAESLEDATRVVNEFKALEEKRKAAEANQGHTAASGARSWWNRGTGGTANNSGAVPVATKVNTSSETALPLLENKEEHNSVHTGGEVIQSTPGNVPGSTAAATSKWWNRGVTTAAVGPAPENSKEIESLRTERLKLEEQLSASLKETAEMRAQMEELRKISAQTTLATDQTHLLEQRLNATLEEVASWKARAEESESTQKELCHQRDICESRVKELEEQVKSLLDESIQSKIPTDTLKSTTDEVKQATATRETQLLEEVKGSSEDGETETRQRSQLSEQMEVLNPTDAGEVPLQEVGRLAMEEQNALHLHDAQTGKDEQEGQLLSLQTALQTAHRENAEYREALKELESTVKNLRDEMNTFQSTIEDKEAELVKCKLELTQCQNNLKDANARIASLSGVVDDKIKELEGIKHEHERKLIEHTAQASDDVKREELESTVKNLREEMNTFQSTIEDKEAELVKCRLELTQCQNNLNDANARIASLSGVVDDKIKELEEIKHEHERKLIERTAQASDDVKREVEGRKDVEIDLLKKEFERRHNEELKIAEDVLKTELAKVKEEHERTMQDWKSNSEALMKSKADELSDAIKCKQELEVEVGRQNIHKTAADAVIAEKNAEIARLTTKINEMKEANDTQVKSLNAKLEQLQEVSATAEKKVALEVDERVRKQRIELDDKVKKEQKEKQKILSEYEKHKKDFVEMQRKLEREIISKGEELGGSLRKIKTLEQEIASIRTENAKLQDEHKATISDLTRQLEDKQKELTKLREFEVHNRVDVEPLKEQISSLQSRHDILVAELEVARGSLDRAAKSLQDKEDGNRKLKARIDELQTSEATLKKSIARLEKERCDIQAQITPLKERIASLEAARESHVQDVENARADTEVRLNAIETEKARFQSENEILAKKLKQAESEMKILERKSAQIVKDLQKQLSKERKHREFQEDNVEGLVPSQDEKSPSTRNSNMDLSRPTKPVPVGESLGVPKVERLTDDLLHLAQENEMLNKRTKSAEDELRSTSERLHKMTEELEQKSNILRQYILRDHAQKLQPDEKPKVAQTFNLNILSSTSAMQRMDPVVLAQINTKMQKLLEELTSKMIMMEGALKQTETRFT